MRLPGILVLALALATSILLAACAEVGPPPGGPVDETPPRLLAASPGSLAVGVDPQAPLLFEFSEKIDRRGFLSQLELIPERPMRTPEFDKFGVRIRPEKNWPVDSVVVWTLRPRLKDSHGVALGSAIEGAFTTADSFPRGGIDGRIEIPAGGDLAKGRLELSRKTEGTRGSGELWRRAKADASGAWRLRWLQPGSGPWALMAWEDRNENGKKDAGEPFAEQDSLFLSGPLPRLEGILLRLIDPEAAVAFRLCTEFRDSTGILRFLAKPEDDELQSSAGSADSSGCFELALKPGKWTVWAYVDADSNGNFGAIADSTEFFRGPAEVEIIAAQPDSLVLSGSWIRRSAATLDSNSRFPPEISP